MSSAADALGGPPDTGVPPIPDDERMTAGELRTVLGWLGLDQGDLARLAGVRDRTVRRWVAGAQPIPDGIRLLIEQTEDVTARAVGELVAACIDVPDPVVLVYRTDEEMHAARADTAHLPESWWRQVAARAAHELPGLRIAHRDEDDLRAVAAPRLGDVTPGGQNRPRPVQ